MIHEPMTLATDYLLTAAAAFFSVRLWRAGQRFWSLAFLFTAAGALAGGTWHGFGPELPPLAAAGLWKVTTLSIGAASMVLLMAASASLRALATVKFAVYAAWMLFHDDFIYVIADYGLSLVIVAVIFIARWYRRRDPASPWMLCSIALFFVAGFVQARGLSPHPRFNNNDLYHLIQLAGLWLMYRGGLSAGSADPRIPPPDAEKSPL